jgi:hypothetical protein
MTSAQTAPAAPLSAPMLIPLDPSDELVRQRALTDAGEAAHVIAYEVLAPNELPDELVDDLMFLVEHEICHRENSTATLRLGHLRLLFELAETTTDGFIRRASYDASNAVATVAGRSYPDASTLGRYYGGWLHAVAAAVDWLTRGGRAKIKVDKDACYFHDAYDVQAIRGALLMCRLDIGDWPTEGDWELWTRLERRLSAKDPRRPGIKQIRAAYGSFAAAVEDTREAYERSRSARARSVEGGGA